MIPEAAGAACYLDSLAGRFVAVWIHARVTANASNAMRSAPITSVHGLSGVRRLLPNRWAGAEGGWRSYMACTAGRAPSGSDGRPQLG